MAGLLSTIIRKRLEYRKNRSLTRAQLEAFKLEKFRRLVRHAYRHSPYYRQVIEKRKIDLASCSPEDFPVLTKSMLLEHFDDIVTDRRISKQVISDFLVRSVDPEEWLLNRYHVLHTSGTTGQQAYFLFTDAEWASGLMQGRRRKRRIPRKIGLRRIRVAYYGAVGGHFAGVSMMCHLRRGLLKRFIDLALIDVNDPLSKSACDLNAYQPDVLDGYTTGLKRMANKQLSGELNISPVMVGTGGEGLTPADREVFRKAWGCEARNTYACTEHLVMGATRPDGRTIELYDDDLIYEFHDDHLVTTNLFNYTQPLIRYRMSDVLRPVENDRSAEPYLLIESIVAREEFMPWFVNRDGLDEPVSMSAFIEMFIPGVSRFQMRYIDQTRFEFAVFLEQGQDSAGRESCVTATRARLNSILAQKQMTNVHFDVVVEEGLPLNPVTGKFDQFVRVAEGSVARGGESGRNRLDRTS